MLFNRIKDKLLPTKYAVGIDFGTSALKSVVLESRGKTKPKLVGAYTINYSTVNYSDDREIGGVKASEIDTYAIALRALIDGVFPGLSSRRKILAISIDSYKSILRSFYWEKRTSILDEQHLRLKIEEWMLGVSEDLVIDFDVLSISNPAQDRFNKMEIFVAITQKQALQHILDICRVASTVPDIIEPEWSSYINTLMSCLVNPYRGFRILLDIGVGGCKILVARGTSLVFTSFVGFERDIIHRDLTDICNTPMDFVTQNLAIKKTTFQNSEKFYRESLPRILRDLRTGLKASISSIPEYEDYEVYITGGMSEDDTLFREISSICNKSPTRIDPFRSVILSKALDPKGYIQGSGRFSVSMGLAIRACQWP